ncbi:hypothetical protein M407DRAFT_34070 [Tulasnella calospora MUT 4182]|uniref:Uncharacterized protein n=1 Tax=Tulasnella calospora MUT 4182 TaxID=1051891 RepID=A0A0C3L3I2_9AGAM|nr:hypothetical protein M407DRAFT_34070 [Tulasnella calospora MUT 4182]
MNHSEESKFEPRYRKASCRPCVVQPSSSPPVETSIIELALSVYSDVETTYIEFFPHVRAGCGSDPELYHAASPPQPTQWPLADEELAPLQA